MDLLSSNYRKKLMIDQFKCCSMFAQNAYKMGKNKIILRCMGLQFIWWIFSKIGPMNPSSTDNMAMQKWILLNRLIANAIEFNLDFRRFLDLKEVLYSSSRSWLEWTSTEAITWVQQVMELFLAWVFWIKSVLSVKNSAWVHSKLMFAILAHTFRQKIQSPWKVKCPSHQDFKIVWRNMQL